MRAFSVCMLRWRMLYRTVREQILQPERCGELYSQRLDSNVELIPHLGGEYDD